MTNKTSVKVSKELSRRITIISLLEDKKKENLLNEILVAGIKPYEVKYRKYQLR